MKGGLTVKIRWVQFLGIFASLLCILWIAGLGLTFKHYFYKGATAVNQPIQVEVVEMKEEPVMEKRNVGYHVVALGDSLTVGAGDIEGKGYVGNIIDQLNIRTTDPVTLKNYAINGLTSEGLVNVMQQREVQENLNDADLILLTIGGNDLFRGGQTLIDLNLKEVVQIEQQFLQNLTQILTVIRELNEDATIYFSGLYHPFTHLPNVDITTKVILDWNHHTTIELAKFERTVFVPTFDIFQYKLETHLSNDRFHPSSEGYQQMANRIAALIPLGGEKNE
jgi:lysophospholipase L1-like esterase